MSIKKLFMSVFFGVVVGTLSIYIIEKESEQKIVRNENRSPSSITQSKKTVHEIEFLSKAELFLLNKSEKKSYLKKVSKALTTAFKTTKVSRHQSIFFQTAWAMVNCPIYGLHPSVKENEADCERHSRGILISEESSALFDQDFVGKKDDGQHYLICPQGKEMCSPALVGFENITADSKPRLRCLDEATNDNCLELSTNGDQIATSLDLLNQANPDFWDEFEKGVNDLCIENDTFEASELGCDKIRTQMKHATREYRNRLTLRYKNLARAIEVQNLRSEFTDNKACQERSINQQGDLSDFNQSGVKFVINGDTCFRIPSGVRVTRNNDGTFKYTVQESNGEVTELVGFSEISARSDRFVSFNCGACNNYLLIQNCVEEAGKETPDFSNSLSLRSGRLVPLSLQHCETEFQAYRDLEVDEQTLERFADPQNARSFRDTHSVD